VVGLGVVNVNYKEITRVAICRKTFLNESKNIR